MTRTQKLNLFTWELADPVSLDQMNENFSLLDISAARTEAALWNSAMGLLAADHAGQNVSLSESAFVDALANPKKTASYTNLYFGKHGAELLSQGYSGSSGHLDHLTIPKGGVEAELCSFRPTGYGRMTQFSISGAQSFGEGQVISLRLYTGGTLLEEKSVNFNPSSQSFTRNFSFSYLLDPNVQYSVKATLPGTSNATIQVNSWTLTATAQVFADGSFLSKQIPVPTGAKRMRLMCSANSTGHTVSVSQDGGAFTALALERSTDGDVHLSTARTALTQGTQTVQLRFELTGAGTQIHDYAVVFL